MLAEIFPEKYLGNLISQVQKIFQEGFLHYFCQLIFFYYFLVSQKIPKNKYFILFAFSFFVNIFSTEFNSLFATES